MGLIMAPGQEANGDNLGITFSIFFRILVFRGDSNEYTQHKTP